MTKLTKKNILLGFASMFCSLAWAESKTFDFPVLSVGENVYSIISPSYGLPTPVNKGWNSNSHFVVTDDGVLVFDTGSSEIIGKGIIEAIQTKTDKPIRWVVNSHSHADHWLGNAAFTDVGAQILSTESSVSGMKADGEFVVGAFSKMTEGATGNSRLVFPNTHVKDGQSVLFGSSEVEFIISDSGHSPGDVIMWLPKQKIVFGGDVLSSDYLPIMTPQGRVPDLLNTLKKVAKLSPKVVLTGHGTVTDLASIKRDISFLDAAWRLVGQGVTEGKSDKEVIAQVRAELGPDFRSKYKDFDASHAYLVTMMVKQQQS